VISFHQLIGAGGKEGARETFERLIAQLVRLRYRTGRRVEANPGDWGLDVIVGEIDGVVSVWQAKFFIDGVGKPQQAQIRESFKQVVDQANARGFTVQAWTLCIPVDLDAQSLQGSQWLAES
jgi:NAD(P)H-hydrate repair Nnr-like enzyme with NAD(P)H-hydrate epimerase domain